MSFLWAALVLGSPIWVPLAWTGIYAFGLRQYCMSWHRLSDKLFWWAYFAMSLITFGLFVWQIFAWQLPIGYRWLLLLVLGVPMLVAMAMNLLLNIMATDSW